MDEVTVRKDELLETVRANRDTHRGVFEAALEGWKSEALRTLNNKVPDLEAGRLPALQWMVQAPEDHTRDYDKVIKMLEMSVDDEITLSQAEFTMYVMDQWAWRNQWVTSNSRFSETVAATYGA